MASGVSFFQPAQATGKKVAVIGAGPAGLSCAGELAKRGHGVTLVRKARPGWRSLDLRHHRSSRAGGSGAGGSGDAHETWHQDRNQSRNWAAISASPICRHTSAPCFSAWAWESRIPWRYPVKNTSLDGLEYIEQSKLNARELVVGKNVLVIGAGNTAIDCATIAKRLGAAQVTMVYRRSEKEMTAYAHEYEFIKRKACDSHF